MTTGVVPQKDSKLGSRQHTLTFLNHLFPQLEDFSIELWDGTTLEPESTDVLSTIVLRSPTALRHMLRPPLELSLSESYIRGEFDIRGDLVEAIRLLSIFRNLAYTKTQAATLLRWWLMLPTKSQQHIEISKTPFEYSAHQHSKDRDRAAIQYHYDMGNDFYSLWLDKRMVYSCAYFPTGKEDIDAAQEAKLEHICRKLRLKPGESLLDIGCGWGGLIIYAAQHYGIRAVGITLSRQQQTLAQQRIAQAGLQDRIEVRLIDYRDLKGETFDKVVSVGMFEHVGRQNLPTYFKTAYSLLKSGGLFLNHGISLHSSVAKRYTRSMWSRAVEQWLIGTGTFTSKYIFPDGELVPLNEVNNLAENAGFEVRDVENLREHYALTLRQWAKRFELRHNEIVKMTDEMLYRTWILYLAGATYAFESGDININQSLLAKPDHGVVDVPRTRADIYLG